MSTSVSRVNIKVQGDESGWTEDTRVPRKGREGGGREQEGGEDVKEEEKEE